MKANASLLNTAFAVWITNTIQPSFGFASISTLYQGASSNFIHPMRVAPRGYRYVSIDTDEDTFTKKTDMIATDVAKEATTTLPNKSKHLVKIDFKEDLSEYMDVSPPYYSLQNEHAVINDTTGECHGMICTLKSDAPIGFEAGNVSFFDFIRAAGCISSASAILSSPVKKKRFYPASNYMIDVSPAHGVELEKELSNIINVEEFLNEASDPIILNM